MRRFRPDSEWRFRTDWELTRSQLLRYKIGRIISILFGFTLLILDFYWGYILYHTNSGFNIQTAFYWIFVLYYCLAVLFPANLVYSNFSYNFKFIGLECGVMVSVTLLGNLLMADKYSWTYLLPFAVTVVMAFIAYFTAKMRVSSKSY